MPQGRFITFEGGEGAGKSTQVRALEARLKSKGVETTLTREPGGAPGAEEIRNLLVTGEPDRWQPLTEALLHSAARHDHLEKTIRPALAQGRWVICDRFFDSTMAYQGYAQGQGKEVIAKLNQLVVGTTTPDLTLIFDLPVGVGLARADDRSGHETRYEQMGTAFHERLRAAFLDIAKENPDRCVVIDAAKGVEEVTELVWSAVHSRYLEG